MVPEMEKEMATVERRETSDCCCLYWEWATLHESTVWLDSETLLALNCYCYCYCYCCEDGHSKVLSAWQNPAKKRRECWSREKRGMRWDEVRVWGQVRSVVCSVHHTAFQAGITSVSLIPFRSRWTDELRWTYMISQLSRVRHFIWSTYLVLLY